jgi:hypothetical protein
MHGTINLKKHKLTGLVQFFGYISPCFSFFSQGSCTPGDLYRTRTRTHALFSINFSVNSSAIPYWPPGKSVNNTQLSVVRRELHWFAASARLLFDGDDAILHNTVRNPSRRVHRSQFAATVRFLCGRTFKFWDIKLEGKRFYTER